MVEWWNERCRRALQGVRNDGDTIRSRPVEMKRTSFDGDDA